MTKQQEYIKETAPEIAQAWVDIIFTNFFF